MAEHPINFEDLQVGMQVVFTKTEGPFRGCGQGGTVQALEPGRAHLVCGEGRFERTIEFAEWGRVAEERPLPAENCVEYGTGECRGPVEWCHAPSGSAVERCEHHNAERWRRYQQSETERFADSDVAPDWFDPAYAGEHWDSDY